MPALWCARQYSRQRVRSRRIYDTKMRIILAPYSAKLPSGKTNPKNFPFWAEVVEKLKAEGHEIIQIGVQGEQRIDDVDQFVIGWPFAKIRDLILECDTWLSIDSWLPHFCYTERLKPGVVIFGQSDPRI